MNGHVELWLWDYTNQVWVKQPASSIPVRRVAVGLFIGGKHKLCWVTCDPSAGLSEWSISDTLAGGVPIVLSCFSTTRETKIGTFSPPINFDTGIYLETFTNMTAVTIGYV